VGRENRYEKARGHPAPCYLKNIIMKKIIIIGYPATFTFNVEEPLPDFRYGCPIRTVILWSELERQNIKSECHNYTDYIVEIVEFSEYMPDHEFWYIGS
jgi:hypothetical protein